MESTKRISRGILIVIAFIHLGAAATAQEACFEGCWDRMSSSTSPFAALDILKEIEGCQAPDFTVKTVEGELISLESLTSSVVVMNFWFIGCKPCIQEMPRLNQLVTSFAGKDVVFLSFASDSREDLKTKFIPRWDFKYKIIPGECGINKKCCVQPYPTHFVIGKSREVEFGSFYSVEKDENYQQLKEAIEEAVAK
jgi:peroxiredoxin